MVRSKFIFSVIIIAILCSSRFAHALLEQHASHAPNAVPFTCDVSQRGDLVHIHLITSFTLMELSPIPLRYSGLMYTTVEIYSAADSLLWRERKQIEGKKESTADPKVNRGVFHNDFTWAPSASGAKDRDYSARIRVYRYNNSLAFDTTISFRYVALVPPPLSLRINVDEQPGGKILINLDVTRRSTVANEFLPSSLTHDYLIYDAQNRLLWQMSYQKMYEQVITPVAPAAVGGHAYYTDLWNGEGNVVPGTVPAGTYTLIAVIPCKPQAARDSLTFTLK